MSDFITFLQDHRNGDLIDELDAELKALTEAVIAHDGKGHVTLKLEISPMAGLFAVFVSDDIKRKLPEAEREGNVMHVRSDRSLSRKNPNQLQIGEDALEAARKLVDSGVDRVTFDPDPSVPGSERTVVDFKTGEVLS